jgi:uncharacterized lipoprotein YehR (DUF1307 family)
MNRIIFASLLIINLVSCQTKKEEKTNNITDNSKVMHEHPIYEITTTSSCPYEIFLNDVLVDNYYDEGAINYAMIINQWILNNIPLQIKAIIYPKNNNISKIISPSELSYFEIKIYKKDKKDNDLKKLIGTYKFSDTKAGLVKKEESWIINNINLPFTNIGWYESVDLRKENKESLKIEVENLYSEIYKSINQGDFNNYKKFFNKADQEYFISEYYSEQEKSDYYISMSKLILSSKNKTMLLNNYTLNFYAHGQLVCLEDNLKKSPIKADLGKDFQYYSVLLYRPKPGAPLEVIR